MTPEPTRPSGGEGLFHEIARAARQGKSSEGCPACEAVKRQPPMEEQP